MHVQLGLLERPEVVGHVVDRPPEELERLSTRRHPAGGRCPGKRRAERLLAKAGPLEMGRGMDLGLALQGDTELGCTGVEATEVGRGNAPVEDVSKQLVPKVDEPGIAGVVEIRAIDELGDGTVEIGDGPIHDSCEDRRDEAAADDRTCPGNLSSLR